ncbi:hypothetical protein AVEN_169164-1 [Araneus ventricosus]|uniref:Uncharacterized protein n=1 Tax=Araneus ventricosus TaxID=182803 RepID=A0A4Y2KBJ0_ARAVE|nr:hypothetical protein AVEN_169164-1 [Araneus ventricosus]
MNIFLLFMHYGHHKNRVHQGKNKLCIKAEEETCPCFGEEMALFCVPHLGLDSFRLNGFRYFYSAHLNFSDASSEWYTLRKHNSERGMQHLLESSCNYALYFLLADVPGVAWDEKFSCLIFLV